MSLLGGILGAVGGLLGFEGQQSANDAQMEMLEKQIDWQREVLQNKVQWNVEDLKSAGMNPVLSVMGSGGASGSAPSASAPQVGNTGAAAVSSAAGLASLFNSFRQTDNETRRVDSEVQLNSARADHEAQNANFQRALLLSGFPEAQTANQIASAKEATANIALMFDKRDEIKQGILKMQEEIKNLQSQRQFILASAQEAKTAAARNAAQAQLSRLDGELRRKQAETEVIRAQGLEIENTMKRLSLPEYEASSAWWLDFNRTGKKSPTSRSGDYQYWNKRYGIPNSFRIGPTGIGGSW